MKSKFDSSIDQFFELCDASGRLAKKLGKDASPTSVLIMLCVREYWHYLSVDTLVELAVSNGHRMPQPSGATGARRQILACLAKHLRRTPTADDLLQRLQPYFKISAETAAVIERDVERLAARAH